MIMDDVSGAASVSWRWGGALGAHVAELYDGLQGLADMHGMTGACDPAAIHAFNLT